MAIISSFPTYLGGYPFDPEGYFPALVKLYSYSETKISFDQTGATFSTTVSDNYAASITFTPVVNFSAKVSTDGLSAASFVDYQFKAGNKYVISFTRYYDSNTSYSFSENDTTVYSWSRDNGYSQNRTMISDIVIQD